MADGHALTDSPWFWVLAFSAMALIALVAIGPKYGGRQARMDVKYQARERIAAERSGQNNPAGSRRTEEQAERREFATPDSTLIPLWPLAAVLSALVILSLGMLVRGQTLSRTRRETASDGNRP